MVGSLKQCVLICYFTASPPGGRQDESGVSGNFCNARLHFFWKFDKTQYFNQIFQLTPEVNWPVSVCCRSFSVLSRPPQWLKAKSKTQPRLKVIYNRGGNKQSDSWGSDSCTKSLMSNFIRTLSTPSCLQPSERNYLRDPDRNVWLKRERTFINAPILYWRPSPFNVPQVIIRRPMKSGHIDSNTLQMNAFDRIIAQPRLFVWISLAFLHVWLFFFFSTVGGAFHDVQLKQMMTLGSSTSALKPLGPAYRLIWAQILSRQ